MSLEQLPFDAKIKTTGKIQVHSYFVLQDGECEILMRLRNCCLTYRVEIINNNKETEVPATAVAREHFATR